MTDTPALFRMPVEFLSPSHSIPEPETARGAFGLPETHTRVRIDKVLSGNTINDVRAGCSVDVNFAGLSDSDGKVASISIQLSDRDGNILECISAHLDEADLNRIAAAFSASLQLVEQKP